MRAVLSWVSLGIDLDLHSIQYTKTTKAICHCYYVGTCTNAKVKAVNDVVSKNLDMCITILTKPVVSHVCFSSIF